MTVSTMTVSFNPETGLISVVPTLPGGAATVAFMLFMYRKSYGVGDYFPQLMALSGTLPITRGQLPFRRTQFFIRVVDTNGIAYDCPPVEMDFSNSTPSEGNVSYTELHVPEWAKIGEVISAHGFTYDLRNGVGIRSTIGNPARVPLVPDTISEDIGDYIASGNFFVSPGPLLSIDQGTRTHSFALGYY